MKLIITLFVAAIFVSCCIAQVQRSDDLAGIFTLGKDDSSSVNKEVSIECRKTSDKLFSISILVLWEPGAEVEIESDNIEETKEGLVFLFSDSFGNRGKAVFKVQGENGELMLEATEVLSPRAARQYGNYKLKRKPMTK